MTDEENRLRNLLGRYVEHVGDEEGTYFLDCHSDWLTVDERREIFDIAVEVRAALGLPTEILRRG